MNAPATGPAADVAADPAAGPFTGTEPLVDTISARLRAALAPTRLEVSNDSHLHAGHAGHDGSGESHFSVAVEAPAFAGLSRVARQRLVNAALADLLATRIHALAIRAAAPGEGR